MSASSPWMEGASARLSSASSFSAVSAPVSSRACSSGESFDAATNSARSSPSALSTSETTSPFANSTATGGTLHHAQVR